MGKSAYEPRGPSARAYLCFRSMKRLGIFPLPLDGLPTLNSLVPICTTADTWVERHCESKLSWPGLKSGSPGVERPNHSLRRRANTRNVSFFQFFQIFKCLFKEISRTSFGRRRFWSFRQIITTVVASLEINKHLLARTYYPKTLENITSQMYCIFDQTSAATSLVVSLFLWHTSLNVFPLWKTS